MKYQYLVFVSLFFLSCMSCYEISNLSFPSSFLFGAATSSYQIEGAWNESGKGPSVWDYLVHSGNIIADGSTGDVACDSYHKYKEDIAMLKDLNANYYRFSISWPRILPTGYLNEINPAGVEYYNNVINGLLEEGIEPWVTIYHWDVPQTIHTLGDWNNDLIVNWVTEYADLIFSLYGDRVKTWITINEPYSFCVEYTDYAALYYGFVEATGITEYLCSHNVLRAHGKIYRLYERKYKARQRGRLTLALNVGYSEPATDTQADIKAAQRKLQFNLGLYAHPLVYGNYPQLLINTIANYSAVQGFPFNRLPKFTPFELEEIKGAYDLLAINYYNAYSVSNAIPEPIEEVSFFNDIGVNSPDLTGYPEGFRKLLVYVKDTYKNPEIVITEQGYADAPNTFNDTERIYYYRTFLSAALRAIHEDGVKLTAYTAWSLMDNFEWVSGYSVRYGLYNVDFDSPNRTRTPKESAYFYKNLIETRCLVDVCEV